MPTTKTATKTDDRPLVRLTGEAAVALRDTLGEPVKKKMLARKAAQVTEDTYRVVVSPEQTKALKEGTQFRANPGKGDVSLRLRDAATRKPMPEASLEKVGDSAKIASAELGLSGEERELLRSALRQRHVRSRRGGHRVAPGIWLEIDFHGPDRGPLRDPVMRALRVDELAPNGRPRA